MHSLTFPLTRAKLGRASDYVLPAVGLMLCATAAYAGADATFSPALTKFTDFLEGSGGKIIAVLSLAGGIIGMASGRFSLGQVATRRLQLAASEGGVPVVILRRWRKAASCPLAEPSAAVTRWRIGSAPSARLGLPGVGRACWQVELVRQRGGEPFSLVLEACDGEGCLALPAAARDRAAAQERAVARAA